MDSNVIDNYVLPDGAREDLLRQGFKMKNLESGVAIIDGHDKGVGFHFEVAQAHNEFKSKLAKVPVYDEYEIIVWHKSKRQRTPERVRMLPPELLYIDEDGEVTGQYAEAYKRFKSGQTAPGYSLAKWGELSDNQIASLAHIGIFSVEQFAATSKSKISRFGSGMVEVWEKAIHWVNGKAGRRETEEQTQKIVALQMDLSKKDQEMAELQEQVKALVAKANTPKKKTKKVITGDTAA